MYNQYLISYDSTMIKSMLKILRKTEKQISAGK